MVKLGELNLVDAAVPRRATFGDAASVLRSKGVSAVAVLDERNRVVGLFTEDDLLAGLFPRYLEELHHTAFAPDDPEALAHRAREVTTERVEQHMRNPVTVEIDSSVLHTAEVFLHCEWGALAIVKAGEFVGMLAQIDFCKQLLATLAPVE
jgi:CBS domain-containing protein